MLSESLAEVMEEQSLTFSLSLPSNDNMRERVSGVCKSPDEPVADNDRYPASSNRLYDDMQEVNPQSDAVEEPQQSSCHQGESLLQEVLKEGKGTEI